MTKLTGETLNIEEENIQKIKELFPEVDTDGKIDFDKLKQLLGNYVEDSDERYNFTWNGKGEALRISQTPSMGTLRPAPEESKSWKDTENLYIEGDNLEVLKLLQKSYFNKIKMIYVDPPYNTGGDFVYEDDFKDNIENYKKITGQIDNEGRSTTTNKEYSGRYHTDWLNMMYARLRVARNLLADDGAIFIHIDEHEVNNLYKIMSDVFGEGNDLGTIIWDKRNPKGVVSGVAYQHEYILGFAKDASAFSEINFSLEKENAKLMLNKVKSLIRRTGGVNSNVEKEYRKWLGTMRNRFSEGELAYREIDKNGDIYRHVSMAAPDKPDRRSHRPLIHPKTQKPCPVPAKGWRYIDKTMDELLKNNEIAFGVDETTQPNRKYYLKDNIEESVASLIYHGGSGDSMGLPFDNPKPLYINKKIVSSLCKGENDIILDFFSGSSTTAHAVMDLNAEDNGNRKFIMVQLPEETDKKSEAYKAGYENIAEIGKERIRRAGDQIKNDLIKKYGTASEEERKEMKNPGELDIGFKTFKLDSSNIKEWNPGQYDDVQLAIEDSLTPYVEGRTEDDVVYEMILKMGLDLTYPVEEYEVNGKTIYSVGYGFLMISLADEIDLAIAEKMIEIKDEYQPEEFRVIFRDEGFRNDTDKTNIKETLRSAGLAEEAFITL